MEYKIFLICLILGLTSGIIYDLLYVARFVVSKSDNLTFLNKIRRKRRAERSLKKASERQIKSSKKSSEKQKNKLKNNIISSKKINSNFDEIVSKIQSEKVAADEKIKSDNLIKNLHRPPNMAQLTPFIADDEVLENDKNNRKKREKPSRNKASKLSPNTSGNRANKLKYFDKFKAGKTRNSDVIKGEKTGRIAERIFLIFCDAAYLLTVSVIFVAVSLKFDFYELRFYMFAAVGLGIAIYCKSLHKLIAFLTNKVYNKITRKRKISVKEYYERRKTQSNSGGNNG